MTPRRPLARLAAPLLGLVGISCGDGDSGNADASFGMTLTTTFTTTGSPSTTETTATEASGSSTDGETGTSAGNDTASETTGSSPDLGVCEDYIACAMETMPEVIATIIATYGPEGSCWMLPGVTEEDCWTECAAQMADLRQHNPDLESCWECLSDAHCSDPSPWCNLDEHGCTNDLLFCDERAETGRCYEGTAEVINSWCEGSPDPQGMGHCPVRASLLGTCRDSYPYGALIYYYSSPLPAPQPPFTLNSAKNDCELDGVWQAGPP